MKMFKKIAILVFLFATTSLSYAATQTINTLPTASSSFIATTQTFLGNELPNYSHLRFQDTTISGCTAATSASLTHTISECISLPNGFYTKQPATSHTYSATKRTFVYIRDSDSRAVSISGATITYASNLVFAEMLAASSRPLDPTGTQPLLIVDTDGTSIVTALDIRNLNNKIGSIAGLRSTSVTAGKNVTLAGYYTPDDGGAGVERYGITGAPAGTYIDNGGSIIVPTGGDGSAAWLTSDLAEIRVDEFGAKGDGTTDDTAAFNAAISVAISKGSTIKLSAGKVYLISSITIPKALNGITIEGEAWNSRYNLSIGEYKGATIISNATSGNIISCDGGAAIQNRGIVLRSLNIKVNTSGFAVSLTACPEQTLIDRCTILNTNVLGGVVELHDIWSGVKIQDCFLRCTIGTSAGNNYVIYSHNTLYTAGLVTIENTSIEQGYYGLYVAPDASHQYGVKIIGGQVQNNTYGIVVEGHSADTTVYIDGTHFEGNTNNAILLNKSRIVSIRNCTFYGNGVNGTPPVDIYINAGGSYYNKIVDISDCNFFGIVSTGYAIYTPDTAYNKGRVTSCAFNDYSGTANGIYLGGANRENWEVKGLQNDLNGALVTSTTNPYQDYSEGTWTPAIEGSTTAGTGTYSVRKGHYVKIGRQVTITCSIVWSAHTGTGNTRISGLPFPCMTSAETEFISIPEFINMTVPANNIPFSYILSGANYISIRTQEVGSGTVSALTLDTAAAIYLSMTYFVE